MNAAAIKAPAASVAAIPAAAAAPNDSFWYKDALIYQLHVKAFFDSNNDGVGDFPGLISKLDYLQALGVNTLWLLPFYPSPLRDDGYDIADYRNVNAMYGTMEDFKRFIEEAHSRNLRVITELVVNHTSDQHAWFQRARQAPPGSPERNFYVWSDTDQAYSGTRIIFNDTELSNWTWDPVAKQYYWHRFFSHQPDLNFDNPEVLKEIIDVMYFWLDMGVDGLRLDAVPYLCEREGTNNENLPETHEVIRKIRAALDARYDDRLLLAEANQWPEDVQHYFGERDARGYGNECHMAFHFPLMPRLYMALAQEDRHPITDILYQTPDIPENCQWATFLRNHDELTLEMVTDRERDYLWNFYAADKRARINFGIRRRLAPLMGNDRRKIELLNALLLSMPGTPIIYYGDEIGMGDNIFVGDRNGVRTPMQWAPDRNGGFSKADPAQLYLPSIMDAVYGYQSLNVEAQSRVENSLLNWMRQLLATAKKTSAFGRGSLRFIPSANRKVLCYVREYQGEKVLCLANLSRAPQPVEMDLKEFNDVIPVEMLSQSPFPAIGELPYFITLAPYGFFWFNLTQPDDDSQKTVPLRELITLVLPRGLSSMESAKPSLQERALPVFLPLKRWFKGKETPVITETRIEILNDRYCVLQATTDKGETYHLLCGIAWETKEDDPEKRLQSCVICRVRQVNRVGVLYEASADEGAIRAFLSSDSFKLEWLAEKDESLLSLPVKSLGADQTNSSLMLGKRFVFKLIRRVESGLNTEAEMSRFLTKISPFPHTPRLMGQLTDSKGAVCGLLYEAVRNQGDGWALTLDQLALVIDKEHVSQETESGYYITLAERLGRRTAQMHLALRARSGAPDFDPEPVTGQDRTKWMNQAHDLAQKALEHVRKAQPALAMDVQLMADDLLAQEKNLLNALTLPEKLEKMKIRIHGDYHLGQVLVTENDFIILDFEGEPSRLLQERRAKYPVEKDIAGMLRSFDYAAASALKKASDIAKETARPSVDHWLKETKQAFLGGYRKESAADLNEDAPLLRFYLLEKALYEIVYEAEHRPDWLYIPLQGILNILKGEPHAESQKNPARSRTRRIARENADSVLTD